jgi:hypothetical protein
MGRRYPIDVVATPVLQVEHHFSQKLLASFLPNAHLADGEILAKHTM